jgi:hypothetical protein
LTQKKKKFEEECHSVAVYINASLYSISTHHSLIVVSIMKQTIMMRMSLRFVLVLLGVLPFLVLIKGQQDDQSGL